MRFFGEFNRNLRQLDLFKIFSFLLVLANLFLTITVININSNVKTIITPPYITSEFENVGDKFSFSYYEQIGTHLSNGFFTNPFLKFWYLQLTMDLYSSWNST